jgi:ribosome-associated heat shock protein Hsp15
MAGLDPAIHVFLALHCKTWMPGTANKFTQSAQGRLLWPGMTTQWCRLERQRLDKWLWHARVVKARTSAAALVEAGHVRVNGVRETAPGHSVKSGDVLTIGLDRSVRVLKVVGFAERRGDAQAARVLYDDLHQARE